MNNEILDKLVKYSDLDKYPFHMPGHKRRLSPEGLSESYKIDITEIDGFDNLHDAKDIIKKAMGYAASLYQSDFTSFLVNGSTSGILAAISAVCSDGGRIMVARNCHKSVYNAIEINRLKPVYIYPQLNTKYGICEGIYPQDVENLWIKFSDIQVLVVTSPTYEGVISDISEICRIAHSHNVPVIVDEAHGAHMEFSDYFPKSAIECGADIVIQSVHKTLPALTQTALIHVNGDLVDVDSVKRMLGIYQSSSPSYILMASIDACMHMIGACKDDLFREYTANLMKLRRDLSGLRNIELVKTQYLDKKSSFDYDRSKIVLSVKEAAINGPQLYDILLNEYGLQMEMKTPDYVLAMTSIGDDDDGYKRLVQAVSDIDSSLEKSKRNPSDIRNDETKVRIPVLNQKLSIYETMRRKKTLCELSESAGRILADYIYIYPPGVPLVTPGEEMNDEAIELICTWINNGMNVAGIHKQDECYMVYVIENSLANRNID